MTNNEKHDVLIAILGLVGVVLCCLNACTVDNSGLQVLPQNVVTAPNAHPEVTSVDSGRMEKGSGESDATQLGANDGGTMASVDGGVLDSGRVSGCDPGTLYPCDSGLCLCQP